MLCVRLSQTRVYVDKQLTWKTVALVLALAVVVGCDGVTSKQPSDVHLSASSEGASRIADAEAALGAANVKSFGGSNKLPVAGQRASIKVRQSDEEKHLIDSYICIDESECFGPQRFERYILATYPEIAKVRFRLPPDLADEDKEDIAHTKQDFRRGLYFAKEIKLANGQTLFDLLTKCSKILSPFNWAEITADPGSGSRHIVMQYFPVLRQEATGEEFELDIHLDRKGDTIEAMSPAFSSSILRDADFMNKHGVSCWHPDATKRLM